MRSKPAQRHYRRDARSVSVAEAAEAHAERVNTNDAWLVAADAWEEASKPERARFAFLRQPRLSSETGAAEIITNAEALETNSAFSSRSVPNSTSIGRLEVYEFIRDSPVHLFAYYTDSTIRTFMNGFLGTIVSRGRTSRAFGRWDGPRLEHVTVRAINGYLYNGRCNLDTGDYCKLKRGKAWLRYP